MAIKGITRRWIYHSLSIVVSILILIILGLAFFIKGYYYTGISQTIDGRSAEFANLFSDSSNYSEEEFLRYTKLYIENFPDKNSMEMMLLDSHDNVITTSTGFNPSKDDPMKDLSIAKSSQSNYGHWEGRTVSGEKCMAVSRVIIDSSGNCLGSVRYIVSLSAVNHRIIILSILLIMIGFIVVTFVILSSLYFIKSIVTPVTEIGSIAKRIAHGDFNVRINKHYNDEIGELCDNINYMADELGTSEKLKNDFISSVSHELRTPLTAIKGWAETLQMLKGSDEATSEKGLKIIQDESERLYGIVEELLDFSRIQSGRMVLLMDKIDILAELNQAVYMFQDRAKSENKNLIYKEADKSLFAVGDKNRLRQVFVNIIDNALKYTKDGGTISIGYKRNDSMLNIFVKDDGYGISAEDLPRVKEKFYKANHLKRGSGIGLAVADEIMKLHKGSLTIKSKEGAGTTVIISIPIIDPYNKTSSN